MRAFQASGPNSIPNIEVVNRGGFLPSVCHSGISVVLASYAHAILADAFQRLLSGGIDDGFAARLSGYGCCGFVIGGVAGCEWGAGLRES